MKINYNARVFYFTFIYICYCCISLTYHKVLLADDLSKVEEIFADRQYNYLEFVKSFLDSTTMAPRPVSGLVTATLIFLSKYNINLYFLGLLFFPLSCGLLYYVAKKNTSQILASLFASFYAIILIGTSVQFSSIMLNSSLALIFYLLSFYYIKNKEQIFINYFISSILFSLSVFSYEIFVPCIILNLFFLRKNKARLIYLLISIFIIIIYRKGIQSILFANSYDRESIKSIFDLTRNFTTIVLIFKMFFRDFFVGIYKSLLNINKINLFEIIISFLATIQLYFAIRDIDYLKLKNNLYTILKISSLGLLLSLSIFFFSTYKPTLFGFDNRNLGAVRLFFSVSSVCILLILVKNLPKQLKATIVSGFFLLIFITNISIKNAWIYASDFNNKMFSDLSQDLKGKDYNCISIDYNVYDFIKNNNNLILREPTFFNNWEAQHLCVKNNIEHSKVYIIERRKCDIIYKYPLRKFVKNIPTNNQKP